MEGEFKIKVGRSIYTYTNFDDIPKEIGAVISFNPKNKGTNNNSPGNKNVDKIINRKIFLPLNLILDKG